MKRVIFSLIVVLFGLSFYAVRPVTAQTETPPIPDNSSKGQVTGTVINRNTGKLATESLEVMLHILDKDFADRDMLHAESRPDGTFIFADVPFDANLQFAVMAVYEGATYFSETVPANMTSLRASVEVPVYESTPDLSNIQVEQMHVVFGLAQDGLETKEIYVFSNPGDRTVKDVYKLDNDRSATLKFPLPKDADYIFFKPEDQDRFVKLAGGFADTYPIPPGTQSSQFMVSYLVPYSGKRDYSYTAPIDLAQINFLLPDTTDLSLQGAGLMGPDPTSLPNGGSYQVYTYADLKSGQTVSLTITGKGNGNTVSASGGKAGTPIAIGAALLGFFAIGAGVWFWRRDKRRETEQETESDQESETDFNRTVNEIAHLDQVYENGEINEEEYRETREELRKQAKAFLEQAADNK